MAVRPLGLPQEPPGSDQALDIELLATAVSWVSLAAVRLVLLLGAAFFVAGWLYLTAFFNFFRMPLGGLEISPAEILLQGAHSLLFPLAVMLPLFFLRVYARRLLLLFLGIVAGSAIGLALLAFTFRWYSATDVIVQSAAVLWIGLAVLAIQQGFGRENRSHRLVLAGAAPRHRPARRHQIGRPDGIPRLRATTRDPHSLLADATRPGDERLLGGQDRRPLRALLKRDRPHQSPPSSPLEAWAANWERFVAIRVAMKPEAIRII